MKEILRLQSKIRLGDFMN